MMLLVATVQASVIEEQQYENVGRSSRMAVEYLRRGPAGLVPACVRQALQRLGTPRSHSVVAG